MSQVITRQLHADEFDLLRVIRLAALADAPEMFAQPLEEARKLSEEDWRSRAERYAAATDGVCFVAQREGETVGMTYGFLDEQHGGVARLGGMWVAPHSRRSGVGASLIARVREWAVQRSRTELRFHVFHAGTSAQAFYRSLGFAPIASAPDDDGFLEFGARLQIARGYVVFKPIDLDAHAHVCVDFRRDSFICSFGEDHFFDEAGPAGEHYIERLRRRMSRSPDGYVHAWLDDAIVGQIEMKILDAPRIGYVNLFYVTPRLRGTGVGGELHEHAMRFMIAQGVDTVRLSVSPTNARAVAFYRKHGWRDLGLRPGRTDVHLVERTLP